MWFGLTCLGFGGASCFGFGGAICFGAGIASLEACSYSFSRVAFAAPLILNAVSLSTAVTLEKVLSAKKT